MTVMGFLSDSKKAMSGSFRLFPLPSCTLSLNNEITALVAGAVLDTVLSFDGLLVFLVGSITTLSASSLLTVALGLTFTIAAVALYRTYEAYRAFMALAPGGLPSSFAGFKKMNRITRGGPVTSGSGYLQALPVRLGSTPYTVGTHSQHQLNQQSPADVQQYFADRLSLFAELQRDGDDSDSMALGSTIFVAVKACDCFRSPRLRTFGCSICCAERSSYGAHVVLHPSDLQKIMHSGWGENHPLADTRSSFANVCHKPCLPGTLALIYAPREYDEVCTVMRIIEAGAKYLASIDDSSR